MQRTTAFILLACLIGVPAGVGAFTFVYAKGYSYLSTDPRACVNCHVMVPQYDGWLKSGHRHSTTCVDCHLPAAGLAKWTAKVDQGFRHSAAFTLQNFKEPIEIAPHDLEIVQDNCLRCHADVVHAVAVGGARAEPLACMHCHAGVGHGAGG